MKCFKIESIEYGWFACRIGKHYVEVSDYLGYDMSKEFLGKLIKVLKGTLKEWIYVMNEPGATMIELMPNTKTEMDGVIMKRIGETILKTNMMNLKKLLLK